MLVLVFSGHALNVLQFGDDQAQQLGLSVDRTRLILISAASLSTAAAVSFSGIIGFVGLIVPHLVRLLWGPDYRRLIPLSILGGATALARSGPAGTRDHGARSASRRRFDSPGRRSFLPLGFAPQPGRQSGVLICSNCAPFTQAITAKMC
jgi:hypothetical protein